ncbi:MAG: FliG C-terminal domain-containing protein [Bdellovibrionota bacterium]
MAMLDRYKKKGGFIQLIVLIETSTKQKQEQFLSLIAKENPDWVEVIKSKTLTIDKILSWDSIYLSEIFSRVQPLTIAVALRNFPKPQMDKVLNCFIQSEQRKIQNIITETNPSPNEIQTCVMKLFAEVRELMKAGILKMEKIDPELVIPENIEEKLQQKALIQSLSSPPTLNLPAEVKTKNVEKQSSPIVAPSSTKLVASGIAAVGTENLREENESLKRKIHQLSAENEQMKNELILVKNELADLKNKIEQIRKTA